jgi:nucleotide-binding universal stress UspA family protein
MSLLPKRVVAAVDGSEQSIRAAQSAIDLARLAQGSVSLITVVRPPEGWWGLEGAPPSPEALARAVAAGQQEILDTVLSALDTDGVTVETTEELGDPTAAIVAHCQAVSADLLVIGRRGAGVFERVILGSVADRLAHHAPCPVLIVS